MRTAAPSVRALRRLLAAVACAILALPVAAQAAPARGLPAWLGRFDVAAMRLVHAVPAASWRAVQSALSEVEAAARIVDDSQPGYVRAGGTQARFFSVTNRLDADLVDARTASLAKDRRWLASVADRLLARAGELTEPFAPAADAAADIEVLLVLVQRMRTALDWSDTVRLESARRDFARLWNGLRETLLAGRAPQAVAAVDAAMVAPPSTVSAPHLERLYETVHALWPLSATRTVPVARAP